MSSSRVFDFFHPNVCQICKITAKEMALKRCSQCHMIAYCGTKHQKQHWRHHKQICAVLHDVIKMDVLKSIAKMNLDRLKYRSIMVGFCEQKLGRKLNFIEMNMVHFQRTCSVCDSTDNLTDCKLCLSDSYCSEHVNLGSEHLTRDCEDLQLCLDIRVFKTKHQELPDYTLSQQFRHDYTDIATFITQNIIPDGLSIVSRALVSDVLTRPLTLLYALSTLGDNWSDTLLVHILGSNSFETSSVQSWGVLLQARPIKNLELHFIGPETTPPEESANGITAFSTTKLYHELVGVASHRKPSVICAFNCGIHEFEGEPNDTWGPSLSAMLAQRVPIVLTSYTVSEATLDVRRLRELDPGLRVRQMANPYADLSPLRDIESLGVYFVNSVLSILIPSSIRGEPGVPNS